MKETIYSKSGSEPLVNEIHTLIQQNNLSDLFTISIFDYPVFEKRKGNPTLVPHAIQIEMNEDIVQHKEMSPIKTFISKSASAGKVSGFLCRSQSDTKTDNLLTVTMHPSTQDIHKLRRKASIISGGVLLGLSALSFVMATLLSSTAFTAIGSILGTGALVLCGIAIYQHVKVKKLETFLNKNEAIPKLGEKISQLLQQDTPTLIER